MKMYMPFCTSCGAEVTVDKKNCDQCGSPMGPDVVPAGSPDHEPLKITATIQTKYEIPRHPKPKPPKRSLVPLIIGGIVIVLVILAAIYFVAIPFLSSSPGVPATVAPTLTPVITQSPLITSIPTPEITPVAAVTTILPMNVRDDRLEENYQQVYTHNQNFSFGEKISVSQAVPRPPLYIKFNLTPVMISRHRLVAASTNNEHYENTTDISPYAWFEVKVFDADGYIIKQDGFGKDYPDLTRQRLMVPKQGTYRIEMSGNDVNADIQMLVGAA